MRHELLALRPPGRSSARLAARSHHRAEAAGGGHDGERSRSRGQSIVGGEPVDGVSFVPLLGSGLCGATLIAPSLLLTARHCLARVGPGPRTCAVDGTVLPRDPNDPVQYPDVGVFRPTLPLDQIVVGGGVWDPAFTPRTVMVLTTPAETICGGDGAVVLLDRPIGELTPAALRLDAGPSVGEVLTAIGKGQSETADQSTELLGRTVTTTAVGPEDAVAGQTDAVPAGFFTVSEGPCRGDSGSPVLSQRGAVVGVASAMSRADLQTFTGTARDCVGEWARGKYQDTGSMTDLLVRGFEAAGASPRLEGEPDPRADLADIGEPCRRPEDCRSNVCISPGGDGSDEQCGYGCLTRPCPSGHRCENVGEALHCLPEPNAGPARPPGGAEDGCAVHGHECCARGAAGMWPWLLALLVAARVARGRRRRSPRPNPRVRDAERCEDRDEQVEYGRRPLRGDERSSTIFFGITFCRWTGSAGYNRAMAGGSSVARGRSYDLRAALRRPPS